MSRRRQSAAGDRNTPDATPRPRKKTGMSFFSFFPTEVISLILSFLPTHKSLCRLCPVHTSWNAFICNMPIWAALDFSNLHVRKPTLLVGTGRKASGQLVSLRLGKQMHVFSGDIASVLEMNAATIKTVDMQGVTFMMEHSTLLRHQLQSILESAPGLENLVVDYTCALGDARDLLGRTGIFANVQCKTLRIDFQGPLATERDFGDIGLGVVRYEGLTGVHFQNPTIKHFILWNAWDFQPAAFARFAPLLSRLETFDISGPDAALDANAAGLFATAIASSTSLRTLSLANIRLFADPHVYRPILRALAGHRTIETLHFQRNASWAYYSLEVGRLLADLLRTPSALKHLNVNHFASSRADVMPLLNALEFHNRTLEVLKMFPAGDFFTAADDQMLDQSLAACDSLTHIALTLYLTSGAEGCIQRRSRAYAELGESEREGRCALRDDQLHELNMQVLSREEALAQGFECASAGLLVHMETRKSAALNSIVRSWA